MSGGDACDVCSPGARGYHGMCERALSGDVLPLVAVLACFCFFEAFRHDVCMCVA